MNNKSLIFVKVIYYIFTFAIGILVAVVLPNYFMYSLTYDTISESLDDGNYEDAMVLVGGYFDKEYVYQQSFEDGGGIVLFESTTLLYKTTNSDGEVVDANLLQKSYAGFLYGIMDFYKTENGGENLTYLYVTDKDSITHDYALLDYDSDEDGNADAISTFRERGFVYIDISNSFTSSISSLKFVDADGNTFKELNLDLDYSEKFFSDVDKFVEAYNNGEDEETLTKLDEEFRSKSANYLKSTYGGSQKKAIKKACVWVIIYFLVIYIIADFLIGKHLIIKLVKLILTKVFKVKIKGSNQKRIEKEDNSKFGHDYYSQVTMKLDTSDIDINTSVTIKYSKDGTIFEFNLLKENNYTDTKRIKAGVYVNPWIDIDANYKADNLPENLMVDGYRMEVIVKIKKVKESEENE